MLTMQRTALKIQASLTPVHYDIIQYLLDQGGRHNSACGGHIVMTMRTDDDIEQ